MDYLFNIIFGIIVVVVVAYCIRWASRRTWQQGAGKSQRHGEIVVSKSADQVRREIISYAESSGLTIEEDGADKIVLSDQPTSTSWGFFYPITLSAEQAGTARVAVGIKSKLMQFGPVVSQHHKKMIAALTEVLQGQADQPDKQ